ncbi:thermonuclease family protein [Maricaulis maris]|uniref:thermonuclease family protein n=1 Tax=Maricaulis maris TaxID=74318 RepID=UPI003B8E2DC1
MHRSVCLVLGLAACGPTAAAPEDALDTHPETGPGASLFGPAHQAPDGPALTLIQAIDELGVAPDGVPAMPAVPPPQGEAGEAGRFLGMAGALTLQLETADGRLEVRLAEVDTPVPEQTEAWLADWLEGRQLSLTYSGLRRDRYDRALAHVSAVTSEGETGADGEALAWVQARLVAVGLARVMSHADNQAQAATLLILEAEARRRRLGMWGDPEHAIRDTHPDARAQDIGSSQIVEGRVTDAVRLDSGRIYLNFGSDYRSDFTVRIDAADSQDFIDANLGPEALLGHRVRVRGWLVEENGPMIRLDHSARLEIVAEDPGEARPR